MTPGAPGAASAAVVDVGWSPESAATKELPSAIPAFLEACGKLAAEALARGDRRRTRHLTDLAARVAAAGIDA